MAYRTDRRTPCSLCGRGVAPHDQFRTLDADLPYHFNCIREAHRRGEIELSAMPRDALFAVHAGIDDRGPEWRTR
jgi:hypothetical protein